MNKRSEYVYELVGKVKERKEINGSRIGYRLIVELSLGKVPFLQVWQNLLTNQRIWKAIENKRYIDKRYVFYCQNWMGAISLNWLKRIKRPWIAF